MALYKHMKYRGLQLCLHILDNDCSAGMMHFIRSEGNQHRLVPLSLHRDLISKQSIQIFKHHLIDGLSIYDP